MADVAIPRLPRSPDPNAPAPAPGAPATGTTPTMSFVDAIRAYQAQNPASQQSYLGIFPWLTQQGFQVERPTRGGGSGWSDDKVVNNATGELYDIIVASDGPNPTWNGGLGVAGYWQNGKAASGPIAGTVLGGTDQGLTGGVGGANGTGRNNPGFPVEGQGVLRGTALGGDAGQSYAQAYLASQLQRKKAQASGRSTTILGGFRSPAPSTRPATALGSGY